MPEPGGWEGGRNGVKGVKRYRLPVIKEVSPGDVIYSMLTMVNNTEVYVRKLLRQSI